MYCDFVLIETSAVGSGRIGLTDIPRSYEKSFFIRFLKLKRFKNGGRITVTTPIRKQDGRQDEASPEEIERFLSVNNAQEDNKEK